MSTRAPLTGLAALVLAALFARPAAADFQVRGRFLYQDRVWGASGFTGSDINLPIRLADVEVRDFNNALVVLGTGATDLNGNFTINCIDDQTRDVYVRVLTKADQTTDFNARVVRTSDSAIYALATPTYPAHTPTVDIDFTANPVVATQSTTSATIGEPFNIFDQALDAFDFIASLTGSRPTRLLTLMWLKGGLDGTYYAHGDASVHLLGGSDSDGYDDTVILHEIGHYIEYNLANSHNPGGAHSLNGYYALTLTWSEGWSTFFANMVRNWKGFARPDLYVDTDGRPAPGTGGAFITYSVENPVYGQPGANNEVTVNALLWDVVDTPAVVDQTPSTDDDDLNLADGPAQFWDVMVYYIKTASSISLEDFWDGWFARGHDERPAMEALFAGRGVEYFPDGFESDATPVLAKTVVAGSPATHRTIYPAGDEDWFVIGVQAASQYVFQTKNLLSGADTRLDLYAETNLVTPFTSNDDVAAPSDLSSRITYTPANSAILYLRCRRASKDSNTYGSYDLEVTGAPVPVELTDVQVTGVAGGIQLRWHARSDGAFSHFEVERGPGAAGPFTVLASVEPTGSGGGIASYEYLDRTARSGERYGYLLVGVESTGEHTAFGPFGLDVVVPARFTLAAPHPNPFNPTTTVAFELPRAGRASLRIYAADGRLVRTLIDGESLQAGAHEVRWDGRSDRGDGVSSGVYWFRLEAGGERQVRRGVLVR